MSKRKKGLVIGLAMVALVVLVSCAVAVDVEWECYTKGEYQWEPVDVMSYEYPDMSEYVACYPVSRNIGDPYDELTEYACVLIGMNDCPIPRVIWAHNSDNIKNCYVCAYAPSLPNYRTIKMSRLMTENEIAEIYDRLGFTDYALDSEEWIPVLNGNLDDFYRPYGEEEVEVEVEEEDQQEQDEEESPISPAEYFSSEEGMEEGFIQTLLPGFEIIPGIIGVLIAVWIRKRRG